MKIVYMLNGITHIISPADGYPIEYVMKDVPDGASSRIVSNDKIPSSRLYRDAWDDSNPEDFVGVDIAKAKEIAHKRRRLKRDEDMAPLDEIISKQIPNNDIAAVENKRQAIRDRYADIQSQIDSSPNITALETTERRSGII